MQTRKQTINRQAWEDVAPQVRDLFRTRQRELLAQANRLGRPPQGDRAMTGAERQRNHRHRRIAAQRNDDFHGYIAVMLKSGVLDNAPEETLDLIEEFLNKPTASYRLRLLAHFKTRPWLLGDATSDLDRFD